MSSLIAPPQGSTSFSARERPWQAPVTVGTLTVVGTLALAVVNPNTTHVPLCPLKALTGLDCPFCGSLRAVHSLTRANLGQALDHNALFTLAVPGLIICWAIWLVRAVGGPIPHSWRFPTGASAVALVVVLAFGVARNTTAFAWLGSTI